jgi:branched-chain amino acid transport system substrate-binding protein
VILAVLRDQNRTSNRPQHIDAIEKIPKIQLSAGQEVFHGNLHQNFGLLIFHRLLVDEHRAGAIKHVIRHKRYGAEAATFDEERLFVKSICRTDDLTIRAKEGRVGQTSRHELKGHDPIVHFHKIGSAETNHIDLDAIRAEIVEQTGNQAFGISPVKERSVNQIYPHDANGLLLLKVLSVQHPHVNDDFVRFLAWAALESDAHPAVGFVVTAKTASRHGIGKGEKSAFYTDLLIQPLHEQFIFVIEHAAETIPTNVATRGTVDRVAKSHVIGRNGLRHGTGSASDGKKSARNLLSGSDLGKCPVDGRLHIDLKSLLVNLLIEDSGHIASLCRVLPRWATLARKRDSGCAQPHPSYTAPVEIRRCLLGATLLAGLALTACQKKPVAPVVEAKKTATPSPSPTPVAGPAPIRAGFFVSLTGKQASFGSDAIKGAQLAAEQINAQNGILGHPFKLSVKDTESTSEGAIQAVKDLIEKDGVIALIGEIATDRSLAAAPIAQAHGIPMITPASTHEAVTAVGDFIFRVCYTDPFQANAMARFARSIDVEKAAVLYDASSPYGTDLAAIFKRDFGTQGGKIVAEASYHTGDIDFRTQLESIKAQNPEVIFLPSYYTEAATIIAQARKLGIDQPFLGTDGWDSPEFLHVGGDAVNNSYFSGHFSAESTDPKAQEFVKAYTAAYGAPPPPLAALAYDSVYLLADSIKRAGVTDPVQLKNALAGTREFPGVTGHITLDEKRNPNKPVVIIRVDKGKFTYLETVQPK